MTFHGQVIWITGASSGIGEALAYALARKGARLVMSSRRREELERVRRGCERADDHCVLPLDLMQAETFAVAVAAVISRFGRIDVLVNNGGVSQRALAADTTLEIERQLMEVDYFGPIALTRAVLPTLRRQRRGTVVVVSSVMGYVSAPGRSSYSAAKHALHGYFNSLRAEVWRDGVGVMLACPGYVRTAISANALGPRGESRGTTSKAIRSGISPERCAAAIVRGLAAGREEIHIGREVYAIYAQRFFPWLVAKIIKRVTISADRLGADHNQS